MYDLEDEKILLHQIRNEEELLSIVSSGKDKLESWQQLIELWPSVERLVGFITLFGLFFFIFALLTDVNMMFKLIAFALSAIPGYLLVQCTYFMNFKPASWLDFVSKSSIKKLNRYLKETHCSITIADSDKRVIFSKRQKQIRFIK